jgi:hypothetical protein
MSYLLGLNSSLRRKDQSAHAATSVALDFPPHLFGWRDPRVFELGLLELIQAHWREVDFSNFELDKVLGEFRAISRPADIRAQFNAREQAKL